MPIPLGVLAVAGAGAGPVAGAAYELLETTVLGSDTADVTFSNLNSSYGSTYQHLQLRMVHRNTANDTAVFIGLQFNADTGNNYSRHYLNGTGSSVTAGAAANQAYIWLGESVSSQIVANSFAATITDILDPFETSKNTTIRSSSGQTGSRNQVWLTSGAWLNTAAITSIKIYLPQGGSYISGSRFSLYGMRSS